EGKAYLHQFVATLTLGAGSYSSIPLPLPVRIKIKRHFFPGDEWIYFKIYCAASNADEILSQKLYPLMKRYASQPGFGKWFFIRYNDPEPHLRLRVQANPALLEKMPGLVNRVLKPFLKNGLIHRLQSDTYAR